MPKQNSQFSFLYSFCRKEKNTTFGVQILRNKGVSYYNWFKKTANFLKHPKSNRLMPVSYIGAG